MDPTTPSSTDNVRALHSRYWERTGLPLDIIRPCIQYLEEHNSNSNSNNKGGNRRTRVPRLPRLKHGRLAKLLTTGAQYHNNSSYNRRYNSPLDLLNHIRREKRALDRISSGVVVIASSSADVSLASKLLDREQSENENENENATLDTFSLVGEIRRVLVLADDIVRSSIEFPREQRLARRRPMLRFDDDDYDDDYDDDDYDDCDYDDCDYNDCDYHDYHDQDDSHQLDTIDEELCLPQPSSSGFRDGAFEMDKDYGCRIRTDLDVDVDVDVDVHVDIEDEDEDEDNPTNASECHNEHEFEHYPPSGMDSSWSLPSMTTFDWVSDANTIFDTEGEGGGEYDIIPESAEARDGIITDNYNDDDNNDNNNNNNSNENDDDNESAWSVLTGCETVHSMGNLGDGRMVSYSAAVRLGISGARKQTRESTTETRSAPPVAVAVTDAAIAAPVPVPVQEDDPNGRDGSARNDVDDDDDRDRAFDDVSIYEGAKSGRGGRASRLFKGNIRHQKFSSTCRVRNQRRANSSRSPAPRKQDKKTRTHALRNNTDC